VNPRPVLFVTTEVPPDRVGAFRALAELVPVEFALFGGGLHATAGVTDHGLPARELSQRAVYAAASSGRYAAVVAGTAGKLALPAAWLGAERAGVPFVLWSALWAHPRSVAHLPLGALLRILYRRSAAVVTYGEHVSQFARAHGARRTVVAPQAVDQTFWSVPPGATVDAPPRIVFAGRDAPGKGVALLLEAWRRTAGARPPGAQLVLAGVGPNRTAGIDGAYGVGLRTPEQVRDLLRGAAALVVPSERTATFREPWGLVVNEAMHVGTLVIASTEVGAVAGGLAEHEVTALVAPAGDPGALAMAMLRALRAGPREAEIAAAGHARAAGYTQQAWARAFASVLAESVR